MLLSFWKQDRNVGELGYSWQRSRLVSRVTLALQQFEIFHLDCGCLFALIMVVTLAIMPIGAIMSTVPITDYFVNGYDGYGYDVPYVLVVPLQIRYHCCYFHHQKIRFLTPTFCLWLPSCLFGHE